MQIIRETHRDIITDSNNRYVLVVWRDLTNIKIQRAMNENRSALAQR